MPKNNYSICTYNILNDARYNFTGTYTLAYLSPVIVNTSENAINRFQPEERGCYTDDEFHLKRLGWDDGFRYSMKNCLYASLLEKIMSNCSCIPDFFGYFVRRMSDFNLCRLIYIHNLQKVSKINHLWSILLFDNPKIFYLLNFCMHLNKKQM